MEIIKTAEIITMARTVIVLSPHDRARTDIVQSPHIKNKETTTVKITRRTKPRIKSEANRRVQTRATITTKKEVVEEIIHPFFVNLNKIQLAIRHPPVHIAFFFRC
jgi:hypothetical protein